MSRFSRLDEIINRMYSPKRADAIKAEISEFDLALMNGHMRELSSDATKVMEKWEDEKREERGLCT